MNKPDILITGVDIVNVNRIKKILNNKREKFYEKIFTKREIEYIIKKGHKPTTVAGNFAAKEAVSKALGTGIGTIAWKDMEILREYSGRPYIHFKNQEIIDRFKIKEIQISISHETDYAIAFVVGYIEKEK